MSNTSATGGYLAPSSTTALPGELSLTGFIQTVLVGLSELPGKMVRPKWQKNPPPNPEDIETNWLAFAIVTNTPDTNAFAGIKANGDNDFSRQEALEIQCSFYGADAADVAALVRDGFQIQQNVEALRAANMGYGSIDPARNIPDLINERWVRKYEQTLYLRRQIQRIYPVLPILSANGTIHTVLGDEEYLLPFNIPAPAP